MAESLYDVIGIGNAIVDVIAHADDAFLQRHALAKGTMTLIDERRADLLYAAMGPALESSGGSAANTIASIASLGGRGAFIGKVREDQLGAIFRHDTISLGIAFAARPAADGLPTGRCLILVTPDSQRTMNTYLGASAELGPADVDPQAIAGAQITYLEGYLWDRAEAKAAFVAAAGIAHQAGRDVALSLSDPFCVARHREDFRTLVGEHVDILFANEAEIVSLYGEPSFDAALLRVRHQCPIVVLTRSEKGAVVVAGDEVHIIDAAPVAHVVDSTGAGDAFAAGFLWGLVTGLPLAACGRVAASCAAEVISHVGARPEVSLAELMRQTLG